MQIGSEQLEVYQPIITAVKEDELHKRLENVYLALLAADRRTAELLQEPIRPPDFTLRGPQWNIVQKMNPSARMEELTVALDVVDPQPGKWIWEWGAGSFHLTISLLNYGAIIIAQEPSKYQISEGLKKIRLKANRPLRDKLIVDIGTPSDQNLLDRSPYKYLIGQIDEIASLAGFHHLTAEQQRQALKNAGIMLDPKTGVVTLVDARGNYAEPFGEPKVVNYFNSCVDPKSSTGHKATWLTTDKASVLAEGTGLELLSIEIFPVKYRFRSPLETFLYMKGFHGLLSTNYFEVMSDLRTLGWRFQKQSGRQGSVEMDWELMVVKYVPT